MLSLLSYIRWENFDVIQQMSVKSSNENEWIKRTEQPVKIKNHCEIRNTKKWQTKKLKMTNFNERVIKYVAHQKYLIL